MVQKFNSGDKVLHKSGGHLMVVVGYEPKDGREVICEWMGADKPYQNSFHQDVLDLYVNPTWPKKYIIY